MTVGKIWTDGLQRKKSFSCMQIGCVEIEKRKKKHPGIIYGKDNGFLFENKLKERKRKGRRKLNQKDHGTKCLKFLS